MNSELSPAKDAANLEQHGVSLAFGSDLFDDPGQVVIRRERAADDSHFALPALEADPGDPEDFEATAEKVERALEDRRERRLRGAQRAPTKEQVALRLDKDVLERLRAGGPGWQTRVNSALRKAVGL